MSDTTDANRVRDKVQSVRDDLSRALLERAAAIEAALLALLTSTHLLLLGPPGTAKSMLVRHICAHLTGAAYFERLLTRFSTPEELFGPLSLKALEQDRYERHTTGTLVDAHIAFLDEVFKANSAILNSLLTLANERLYHEAGTARPVPLVSLFAASNETPEDESLAALYDRFLLRVCVPYLADDASMRALLRHETTRPTVALSLDDVRDAQAQVAALPLSDEACEAVIAIKHGLEAEGITVSAERCAASLGPIATSIVRVTNTDDAEPILPIVTLDENAA